MLYELAQEFPNDIIFEEEGPFISLYQPTHRRSSENRQDLVVFKKLLKEIEKALKEKYPETELSSVLDPFYKIAGEKEFWNKTHEGLGILATKNKCVVYKLNRPVEAFACVSDNFDMKPLIRFYQSADKYQLLGLSGSNFTLYEGNRYGFEEIEIDPSVPRTLEEVLGDQYSDSYLAKGAYGGGAKGAAIFHGHGSSKEEVDKDTEKYFRHVDRFVLDNYSKESKVPLILVSVKENHQIFSKISKNPYLMESGIRCAYDSLENGELRERAWKVLEPLYLQKTAELVESFENAKAKSLGSDDLKEVGRAAVENRIATIMIESDRVIDGEIDTNTGEVILENLEGKVVSDILAGIAELVIKGRGRVVVLPKERMPNESGIAAIYRY